MARSTASVGSPIEAHPQTSLPKQGATSPGSHAANITESPGSPIRYYMTVSTFFPVMGFYAAQVGDCIEILDFIFDENYEDLLEDDPDG
jgi:hypothetical protein